MRTITTKITENKFIASVYKWMSIALMVTGLVAYYVSENQFLIDAIMTNKIVYFGLFISHFILVIYLVSQIEKIKFETASLVFLLYSILNGVTFSLVFYIYTADSIASTFLVTSVTFIVMSLYGYYTKKDLTTIGNLAFMALIGIIIASIVNFFLKSTLLYWIVTYVGILVFVGLIAYDTQKLKNMKLGKDIDTVNKQSILGALSLYLDFVNLFLMLLRLLGNRK